MNHSTTTNRQHQSVNPNIAALGLQRPTPKSHKIIEVITSFEILARYTKSRHKVKSSSTKTIDGDHRILTKILHFCDFTDLNELDREGAECISEALTLLPKNSEARKELKGLTGFDLIVANQALKKPYEVISYSTKKGYVQKFSSFLNWAQSHGHVNDNVFYKLRIGKDLTEKQRFPFCEEHLNKIFSMRDYTEHKYYHPYYYWIPLMLRYSGLRLNEACQLEAADIQEVDGVDCILVRQEFDGQRVKTQSSFRVVPIHNELKSKGFLSFVKQKKNGRLFPELPLVKGYYSNNASKWFARRREKLGLGKGLDAHSFRHTFINELKQKGVSKEIVECIVGHLHNSESFDRYSYQYSPAILAPIVNMIDTSHTASVLPYMH